MSWLRESQDHLPLTWWKGHPIYLAAILALVGGASMVVTALVGSQIAPFVVFDYVSFTEQYRLWTPLTYALFNPPGIWAVIGCVMLWRFGEAVERHLGRRAFVRLVVVLLALQPVFIFVLGLVRHEGSAAGITELEFGVFIAFATLYPRAQLNIFFATIEAWLLAAVLVGIYALGSVFFRDWLSLLLLAAETGAAFGFIRYEQGVLKLPSFKLKLPGRPAPLRREGRVERPYGLPTPPVAPKRPRRRATAHSPAVDDILDKISREGMHSLTPEERVILERASHDLQKRQR